MGLLNDPLKDLIAPVIVLNKSGGRIGQEAYLLRLFSVDPLAVVPAGVVGIYAHRDAVVLVTGTIAWSISIVDVIGNGNVPVEHVIRGSRPTAIRYAGEVVRRLHLTAQDIFHIILGKSNLIACGQPVMIESIDVDLSRINNLLHIYSSSHMGRC